MLSEVKIIPKNDCYQDFLKQDILMQKTSSHENKDNCNKFQGKMTKKQSDYLHKAKTWHT